ncbi:DUF1648 domain-containing protein [Occallatibacter savannae]|uniref:DUF1648 domain-containing protein n=1 Tax=Occallatibacter savannae TaxID=1002691 RepID=UPI000D69FCF6|nr:DUF1648 domain-containing protein [Occallatibacter savannae]
MRKTIEVPGLVVLGYLFWITYWALNGPDRLPDRVPTHFDITGRPNAWGSPGVLWILPVVGLGLYLLMTALASIQFRTFNLPVRVTEINLPFIQQKTREMVALIKMEILCLFVYIQSGIINGARIGAFRLSPGIVPVFMAAIFATLGIYMVVIIRGARARAETVATTEYVRND